jgi:nitrite reductase/ring-hydroxylating ferredoxin subunit
MAPTTFSWGAGRCSRLWGLAPAADYGMMMAARVQNLRRVSTAARGARVGAMGCTGAGCTVLRRVALCRLSELRGPLEVELGPNVSAIVLKRRPSAGLEHDCVAPGVTPPPPVVAFLNRCPHVGVPLNLFPGSFLDRKGEFLLCATHGALFQQSDGLCLSGPCVGEALTTLRIELELEGDADPAAAPPASTDGVAAWSRAPAGSGLRAADPRVVLLVDDHALAVSQTHSQARSAVVAPTRARAASPRLTVPSPGRGADSDESGRSGPEPGRPLSLDEELEQVLAQLDAKR